MTGVDDLTFAFPFASALWTSPAGVDLTDEEAVEPFIGEEAAEVFFECGFDIGGVTDVAEVTDVAGVEAAAAAAAAAAGTVFWDDATALKDADPWLDLGTCLAPNDGALMLAKLGAAD